ncbi:MAG: choice-of-anchor X domain-containing protein [Planctomycetota bacterium]|jgi:hypothetical protein
MNLPIPPSPRWAGALVILLALALFVLGGCSKKDEEDPGPRPLALSNAAASPDPVLQGLTVLFTVDAASPDGAVTTVTIDLTPLGLAPNAEPMLDDGTGGDLVAADGTWSYALLLDINAPVNTHQLPIHADDSLGQSADTSLSFTVAVNNPPVLQNGYISRDPIPRGDTVLVTVDATDADANLSTVTADLGDIGGAAAAALYDDGTNGDVTAADDTYSLSTTVATLSTPGIGRSITFTGTDAGGKSDTANVIFEIQANIVPQLANALATPPQQVQRLDVLFTVQATDDGTINSVVANLVPIGGPAAQPMYDDGTNGDVTSGDTTYSILYTLGAAAPPGTWSVIFTATDDQAETAVASIAFTVFANQPPSLASPLATPDPTSRNQTVLFTVQATDPDGTVTSVVVDLSTLNGTSAQTMYDDGTNGDAVAADDTYSLSWNILPGATVAAHSLGVTAVDDDTVPSTTNISLNVLNNVAPNIFNPTATPDPQEVGLNVLIQVDATDDLAVASVIVDMTGIGGIAAQPMYDDGTNGDPVGSDGTFSYLQTIGGSVTPGAKSLYATATDAQPVSNSTWIFVTVNPNSPPTVSNEATSPGLVQPGQTVLLTADVNDAHTIASVTADLSGAGRSAAQILYDDGTNGDLVASDGTYSFQFIPGWKTPGGPLSIPITATDALSAVGAGSATLNVARFKLEHAAFLEDIHGTSPSNLYVTGQYGQVFHYDGSVWRMMDPRPGTNVSWWGVWCESANSVWIGGTSGRVCHFDGNDWTNRDIGGAANYEIRAFWYDGTDRIYAVGGRTGGGNDGYVLAYWSNTSPGWTIPTGGGFTNPNATGGDLSGIFGVSATDFVAVGDDGLTVHGDGTNYDTSNSISTNNDLFGVWGYNDGTNSHYWAAAGRLGTTTAHQVYYFNSTAGNWTTVNSLPADTLELRGIYGSVTGTTLNAVYVTGTYDNANIYGCVWESTDGQNFTQVTTGNNYFPNAPYRLVLSDIWIDAGAADVWVVGRRCIQHYNPTGTPRWTEFSRGTYEDTRAVDVFSSSRALTWDYPFRRTSGSNPTQISSIVHDYGSGVWTEYTENTGSVGTELQKYTMLNPPSGAQQPICPRMYAIKMFTATDVYGVGDDGHVFYWNGVNSVGNDFTSQTRYGVDSSDQRRLYALWGLSATDFWFAGEDMWSYHYLGTNWASAAPTGSRIATLSKDVTALWGSANNDIYATVADEAIDWSSRANNAGELWYYNGSWSSAAGVSNFPAAGSIDNLNAVWGTGQLDVWVVGDDGFVQHYTGSWTDKSGNNPGDVNTGTTDLTAVFGNSSNSEVYILGAGLRMWVKQGSTWYPLRANGSNARFMGGDAQGSLILLAGTKGITLSLEK